MIACPTEQVLRAALAQELTSDDDRSCNQHVEFCTDCQRVLERLVLTDRRSARLLAQAAAALETPNGFVAETGPSAPLSDPYATVAPSVKEPRLTTNPNVPGYEVLKELGRGGMGVVFLARQTQLNRLVALKMIRGGNLASGEELARFRAEAEAVAQLQHQNIVQIHEVGTLEGMPFFSLEYLAGGTLAERLRGQPLPPRIAAAMLQPLAEAVHVAHQKGIIHRDLKPANVLLADKFPDAPAVGDHQRLSTAIPKITDFGLAKRFDLDHSTTQTGVIVGTPDYMAPEQASGQRNVGPSVDIFAMGAMFYEMLTGRPPFRGTDPLETLRRVRTEDPIPPSRLIPSLPRDLETICLKCLQKEPQRRYLAMQDLADDLGRYLADEPIRARPIRPWERAVKWAKRKPVVAGLFVALLLALAGLSTAVVMLWQANQVETTLRQQAESNQTKAQVNESKAVRYQRRADQVVNELFVAVAENELLRPDSMREVRLLLLEKALPYYQEFRQERGDDPGLMVESAINQGRVALIFQERGEWEKARLAYEETLGLWEKALAAKLDIHPVRAQLAKVLHALGQVQSRTGRVAEGEQSHRRAAALLEKLAAEYPNDEDILTAWASVQTSLAARLGGVDRFEKALKSHQHLVDKDPLQPLFRANLARTYAQFAVWYASQGKSTEADNAYGDAIRLQEKVVAEHPDQAEFRDLLALLLTNRGLLAINSRRLDVASNDLERAAKLRSALSVQFPTVRKYRYHEAQTATNLGLLYLRRGRRDLALTCFEKNLTLLSKLIQEGPDELVYQLDYGTGLTNRGLLAFDLNQPRDALNWFEKAIDHQLKVLRRFPRHGDARSTMCNAQQGRARVLNALERHQEASKAWEQAITYDDQNVLFFRIGWMKSLAQAGDLTRALAEARKLKAMSLPPGDIRRVAQACAVASHAATQDANAQAEFADLAINSLLEMRKKFGTLQPSELASYWNDSELKLLQHDARFQRFCNRPDISKPGK